MKRQFAFAIPVFVVGGLLVSLSAQSGPPLFSTSLPKEEFAERRAKVLQRIGDGAVVMQGATESAAYEKFRQSNQFYYLTGVETPRAILVLDGRTKSSTLYLLPTNELMERSEGPLLAPGAAAEQLTGIEHVKPRADFDALVPGLAGRTIYTTVRGETVLMGTPDRANAHARAREADQWDLQGSREAYFRSRLAEKAPGATFESLDDILDEMRMIKSPREIALLRESSRIAALAHMEAMRSAEPGMYEYEIEAIGDYLFKSHNAWGPAYFGLTASGANAFWPHYHAAQTQMKDGDLVLFDYAPDFHYYTSDVTRMWPVNGKFSPDQCELYGIYLKLYQAIMTSIRPAPSLDIFKDIVRKMDAVMASSSFANPKYKAAAERFVESFRARVTTPRPNATLGHMVGMEVHDVQKNFTRYQPGMVFTIEPALTIPEDRVYIRLEDMLLITPTGYENMSSMAPVEIAAIEKLMAEPGLGQATRKKTTTTASK
ncbi:MAG TPA: Xaa-Pro peptidase family protein [Vicinamibacterales bacterium]|jgi:Xaa-Pro aminopeptidase|nr:Xaa-Pro peptidase family protein [Vicinamibacterales bacterium]